MGNNLTRKARDVQILVNFLQIWSIPDINFLGILEVFSHRKLPKRKPFTLIYRYYPHAVKNYWMGKRDLQKHNSYRTSL
jgi:hypothetical protein